MSGSKTWKLLQARHRVGKRPEQSAQPLGQGTHLPPSRVYPSQQEVQVVGPVQLMQYGVTVPHDRQRLFLER